MEGTRQLQTLCSETKIQNVKVISEKILITESSKDNEKKVYHPEDLDF